ncbi:MAG: NADH-quinone oxidoreductase subunit E [Candidatus Krumholzibacteriia bacterium]|jgi:NADH-quinone oxidoreductase subunit E
MSETTFTLSPTGLAAIDSLIERYPTKASALMPSIWVVMDEVGYVPSGAVDLLTEILGVSRARVYELLSFYTMFRTEPQADHTLQVCHNISCHIMGARPLIAHIEKRLGIRIGETTPDNKFALEGVECIGACGMGPCMQLGKHLYENLTNERMDEIMDSLRKDVVPRADTERLMVKGGE